MTFSPYAEYKFTGRNWLNKIPLHWKLLRNKYFLQEVNVRSTTGEEVLLTVSQYTGVTPRKTKIDESQQNLTNAISLVGYKLVRSKDIVMNIMLAWNGSLGASKFNGIVSPAYCVYRSQKNVNSQYLHYLYRTPIFTGLFKTLSTGVVDSRLRLYPDVFFRLETCLPPLSEQEAIVRFLDYKCAQINKFIQKKKRLIELLKEQKQVIINQAVTRGLDPNVRLKPSGVEWLSDIPEHWDIVALKHLATLKSGEGITSLSIEEIGSYPVYGGNGIRGYTSSFTHQGLYPLIGRQGALCGNVHLVEGKFWASEHAVVVKPKINLSITWLTYLLKVMNLNQYSESAAQPGLSVSKIQNLKGPLPTFKEQCKIACHIEMKITPLESAIAQINKQIQLIQEYRTRLISDVVTGQIDIRNVEIGDIVDEEFIEEALEEEQEEATLELVGASDDD